MIEKHEVTSIVRGVVRTMKEYMASATASIDARLAEFEAQIKAIPSGPKGDSGANAYELACVAGYVGPESEWLKSLKGTDGKDGQDGKDAAALIAGDGPPLMNGNPGDIYLDCKTGDIYRFS